MGRHYDDPLEFLLDGAAESETDGACRDLTPTPKLRAQWSEFEEAVAEAMLAWGDAEDLGDEVSQVIQNELYAYDVYMTLDGAGVGIWDGRWEPYLPESKIARLESHLKGLRVVGEAFRMMEGYIRDEVWYLCRGRRAKGEKLDPTLNGPDEEQQPDCRNCDKPHAEHEYRGGQLCCKRWHTVYMPMRIVESKLPKWATPRR